MVQLANREASVNSGTAETPPCCDGVDILKATLRHPARVAIDLRFQFSKYLLSPDHLNRDGSYVVKVTDTFPHQNLYGVRWGDGATSLGHLPTVVGPAAIEYTHTYASSPVRPLKVFILENGRMSQFVRTLSDLNADRIIRKSTPSHPLARR